MPSFLGIALRSPVLLVTSCLLAAGSPTNAIAAVGKRVESIQTVPAVSIIDSSSIGSASSALPPGVCLPGEIQKDYLAGARVFGSPVRVDLTRVTSCAAPGQIRTLQFGSSFTPFVVGGSYDGCLASSIVSLSIANRYALAKLGCADGSIGLFEFEWDGLTGGSTRRAVGTGDVFSDGSTIGDLQLDFDVRWDGEKLGLGYRYVDTLGREGIGMSLQGPAGYSHEVAVRSDLLGGLFPRGVQLYYDCPESTEPGDAGCPIPAPFGIAFGVSTTPFGSITQMWDAGGAFAVDGDFAPGFGAETFVGFLEFDVKNFSASNRSVLFTGTTSAGNVGLWRWNRDLSSLDLEIGSGDPVPDTSESVFSVSRPSMDPGGWTAIANSTLITRYSGRLRGLARAGIDVVNLGSASGIAEVQSVASGRRSLRHGLAAPVLGIGGTTNSLAAVAIERVEILKGGSDAVYGADAVAGVVNFVLREPSGFSSSATPPPPGEQLRSASFDSLAELRLGASIGSSYRFDRTLGSYTEFPSGEFVSWQGLEHDDVGGVFATSGSGLYTMDATTYAASFVATLQDSGGGGFSNLRGLAFDPDSSTLFGLRAGGELGVIDTTTGLFTQTHQLPIPPSSFWDSVAFDEGGLVYAGTGDGRLAVTDLAEGAGSPIPELPISMLGKSGSNLSGLTVMLPEPGLGTGLAVGVLLLRACGRRHRHNGC